MDGGDSCCSTRRELPACLAQVEYLSVGGGGTRVLSFLGILQYLHDHGMYDVFCERVRGAVGASSGCFVAVALLCHVPSDMLAHSWQEYNIDCDAQDIDLGFLYKELGLKLGDKLQTVIANFLKQCGMSETVTLQRFRQLTGKEFRCYVTVLDDEQSPCRVLTADTDPGMTVAQAMYMSMTIPLVMPPMEVNGAWIIDGCLSNSSASSFPSERTFHWHVSSCKTSRACNRHDLLQFVLQTFRVLLRPSVEHMGKYASCVHVRLSQLSRTAELSILATDAEELGRMRAAGYAAAVAVLNDDIVRGVHVVLGVIVLHRLRMREEGRSRE